MTDIFRVYEQAGPDGYPPEWHQLAYDDLGIGVLTEREPGIKHLVRAEAGNRCVRCGHPYEKGMGEWSPCDEQCTHEGPTRGIPGLSLVQAQWRILTVHHLNGVKLDCRWWNLAALCQRCHLTIQGKVRLERQFIRQHSDWFKPYAAGWYAHRYLGEDLTREQALERMDELLGLQLAELPLF